MRMHSLGFTLIFHLFGVPISSKWFLLGFRICTTLYPLHSVSKYRPCSCRVTKKHQAKNTYGHPRIYMLTRRRKQNTRKQNEGAPFLILLPFPRVFLFWWLTLPPNQIINSNLISIFRLGENGSGDFVFHGAGSLNLLLFFLVSQSKELEEFSFLCLLSISISLQPHLSSSVDFQV